MVRTALHHIFVLLIIIITIIYTYRLSLVNDFAFDDFLDRPQYHIVLHYYDIVEKTSDKRMVILQKKKNINHVPEELIQKYELIPN
jgi:hypothetical protein